MTFLFTSYTEITFRSSEGLTLPLSSLATLSLMHDCLPVRCIFHHSRVSFNKDPQTLSSWLESSHLTVNSTKTLALSVGPCDYDYSLFFNDARIEFLKSIKILGVNLDKDLSYKEHISDQLKKVYAKASALRRIRRFLPHDAMMLNFIKHLYYLF